MALRIIRKSASQSQVEIIKGTGETEPLISLLFFVEHQDQLSALNAHLEAHPWVQENAQCLIMKSKAIEGSIRSYFTPLHHTLKLINEPKSPTWSQRLRSLMQEAQTDWVVFVPQLEPEVDLSRLCQAYLAQSKNLPNTALMAPVLTHKNEIIAAGQMQNGTLSKHHLWFDQAMHTPNHEEGLYYFYEHVPLKEDKLPWKTPLLAQAVPLAFAALHREAYLKHTWKNQDWNLPWLAQELSQTLTTLQYRIAVIPVALQLSENTLSLLEKTPMPEGFTEQTHLPTQDLRFRLYRNHGFIQKGTQFVFAPTQPDQLAQSASTHYTRYTSSKG